jgi:signal transduction histidine kinase
LDGVDGADLADLPDLIAEIDRESRQLARVVDDFLAFARPGTLRSEPCDLVAIARRIVDRAGAGRVTLTAPPAPAPFAGDALLVERALGNVVDNALRAHAEAGVGAPVELCLEPAASSWRIAVVDRGAGIPESIRPQLFEPFATGRPDGVGLGLALARRIVVLHGGEIAVESREPAGTAVEIRLPRDDSE